MGEKLFFLQGGWTNNGRVFFQESRCLSLWFIGCSHTISVVVYERSDLFSLCSPFAHKHPPPPPPLFFVVVYNLALLVRSGLVLGELCVGCGCWLGGMCK